MVIAGHSRHEEKPASGWACIGVGVGFIVVVTLSLVLVLTLVH
ncbi:hypothetical protein GCM10010909_10420 [Acidocella aquatica]|uniref:Uncharacterized protein n=1 Tax=Acidocella aquatica TaxID=1922313 RepID=A0ABQ6A3X5_9PROT|nr:hypothetical protein [Acidocella aquatica]GLR66362.1 hypothetical protein GCM10010909_10420 [Acidocella aquatica]